MLTTLFLTLTLPLVAETLQQSYFTARDGDDVTFSCDNVMDTCDYTSWLFTDSTNTAAVELVTLGQVDKHSRSESDRLSLTQNCALVLKKVSGENAGRYTCITFDKSRQSRDAQVDLSVIKTTEHKNNHGATLSCVVETYGSCRHTVQWLFHGGEVDNASEGLEMSQSHCSANVTFGASGRDTSKIYELLRCNVTHSITGKDWEVTFEPQSTADKTDVPWRFIFVSVGLVALSLTVVSINIWERTKGHKTH